MAEEIRLLALKEQRYVVDQSARVRRTQRRPITGDKAAGPPATRAI